MWFGITTIATVLSNTRTDIGVMVCCSMVIRHSCMPSKQTSPSKSYGDKHIALSPRTGFDVKVERCNGPVTKMTEFHFHEIFHSIVLADVSFAFFIYVVSCGVIVISPLNRYGILPTYLPYLAPVECDERWNMRRYGPPICQLSWAINRNVGVWSPCPRIWSAPLIILSQHSP